MTAKEREYWELFDLSDKDNTGILEVDELRRILAWLRENVAGGDTGWLTTMWEALPVADKDAVTIDVEPIPPADSSPTDADASPDESNSQPIRLEDMKFVEDGKMNLKEFYVWMELVTASFTPQAHADLIFNLKAILKKEKVYYNLFKLWDVDKSGTLDCGELMNVVQFFKEHFEAEEQRLKLEARFQTLQGEAAAAAAAAPADAPAAAPATAVPQGTSTSLTGWTDEVLQSITTLTKNTSTVDLNGFKDWLRQVSGHLSEETFDAAMEELYAIVSKRVVVKDLFQHWDKDNSGALDFGEMGQVLQWFQDNMPSDEVDLSILWADLQPPANGKITQEAFEAWWQKISTRISPVTMKVIAERLKEKIANSGPSA